MTPAPQHESHPSATQQNDIDTLPWWRVPMVWVVIAGPLSVVLASLLTAVIAWKHIDPIIHEADPIEPLAAQAGADPKSALAPAGRARNHAATPADR